MKALTYEIHLLEPLLATRLGGGDPNSAVGFEFIPGSLVRGMVIGRYARQNPTDAADATFRRLFLDGGVRFLHAYPQVHGRRALPVPLSWHREKDGGKTAPVYDFAVEVPEGGDQQWQKVEQPFCHLWVGENGGYKANLEKPEQHINIHTAREDRQRVTKGESTVFRYEALALEQIFRGVIVAEQGDDLETLKQWLPEGEVVYLGGSHLAGYGQVRLQNVDIQEDWCEYTQVGDDTDFVIVTLLSDALIRDPRTGAYITTLEPIVGYARQAFVNVRVVGGFNRKWNLPLPQTPAVQAGSVFVYPADDGLLSRLQSLEMSGIGERRAEGFGRIAVNWHRAAEIVSVEKPAPSTPLPFTLKDSHSVDLARRMVERMLRQKLDRALIAAVNRFKIQNPPSNAQLSRMRIVARQALSQNDAQVIIQHLDRMKKGAHDQFQRAKVDVDNKRLDEWLRAMAENVQGVRELLGVNQKQSPVIGGIRPDWTETLALEYTIRLLDRVLQKAQKEATNE